MFIGCPDQNQSVEFPFAVMENIIQASHAVPESAIGLAANV